MTAEIKEITQFLAARPPFDELPEPALKRIASRIRITYHRKGAVILNVGAHNQLLYLVRKGAVALYNTEGNLVAKVDEGRFFGYPSLLADTPARHRSLAIEDLLLYEIDADDFHQLRAENDSVDRFFKDAHSARLIAALRSRRMPAVSTVSVAELVKRAPVSVTVHVSIQEAARTMQHERVSCLPVLDGNLLVGIVTDKDMRTRVVAQDRPVEAPIATIMTPKPVGISSTALAHDALLLMVSENIHHLPVSDGDRLVGVVTVNDLIRLQTDHPVFIVGEISRQQDPAGIAEASSRVSDLFVRLAAADARADQIGQLVTAVTDAVTRRLLALAEQKLGPPPVPYTWLALGSQGRREQTMKTDQDNALVLADTANETHDVYFESLANYVNDGLHLCGYVRCPGDVMASNPRWRQPLSRWRHYFEQWIKEPEPKALMHASIFFDLRAAAGDPLMVEDLKAHIRHCAEGNELFLGLMSKNALTHQPPLGFFRQFVLEKGGDHDDTLDLKHRGIVPIVDLARLYALSSGVDRIRTTQRLQGCQEAGRMTSSDAASMIDALEFISYVRIQHQRRQIENRIEPDNFVLPDELSPLVRRQLKAAFGIVTHAQAALQNRFPLL